MKQCLAVLCTFFWITFPSYSQPQERQGSRSNAVHFVEITKIDAKGWTLTSRVSKRIPKHSVWATTPKL